MLNLDSLIDKIHAIVKSHCLAPGAYARWLWQNSDGTRKMGLNEYGCADAANILYSIGSFPQDPEERVLWISTLQGMQNPETGLFLEGTHHTIHTTAHCLAALELFDARPLYPLRALEPCLDFEHLHAFLWNLDWDHRPWDNSHQGAGLFASLAVTHTCSLSWQNDYFSWLASHADPETGLGLKNRRGDAPLAWQLFGWFHYFFNHEYAHRAIPYPEKIVDSCINLYLNRELGEKFAREIGFMEIDWVFALNRALRQTPHRFSEAKALLLDFAEDFIPWLDTLDPASDEGLNDLHMLFGTVCVLSELQQALPGKIESTVPLKLVLDRRPFI